MDSEQLTQLLSHLSEFVSQRKVLSTVILVVFMLLLKRAMVTLIKRSNSPTSRETVNVVNNLTTIIILLLVIDLWASEIKEFALSITAFMVAIVLATRDFIQCIVGLIYLAWARPFRVGDWIQIGDEYGEVDSINWTSMRLQEVNIANYQFTGKTLNIPNSQFITSVVKNLNFLKRYAVHSFTVTYEDGANPYDFIDVLYSQANDYCADFRDVAVRYNQMIENRLDINIAGPEPKIRVETTELGKIQVIFTVFCPTERALEIEQKLTDNVLRLKDGGTVSRLQSKPAEATVDTVPSAVSTLP